MKTSLILLLILFITSHVYAGAPDIESNNLKIGKIITTADEIIILINGHFNLFTIKTPDEEQSNGSGKSVSFVIRDGILRIPKRKWRHFENHPGGNTYQLDKDWDKYKQDIMKWERKEIFTQMWSTEVIIRSGMTREIVVGDCLISSKHDGGKEK